MNAERKREQEKANAWQKTSVQIIHRVRVGVLVFGVLMVAWLFVKNMGFPRNVEETLPACVITEGGKVRSCEVSLKGEITNYPFKKDEYGMEDWIKVWFGDQWLVEFEYYHGTFDYTVADAYWSGDTVSGMMSRKRDLVILELDVKTIFQQEESQRCVLIAPAQNPETAMELFRQVAPEELINSMEWVKKIKG